MNEYLQNRVGHFSAKDFRTWGGTLRAATVLAELGPAKSPTEAKRNVALAMRLVSSELGNTPTICRKSYVHPMVDRALSRRRRDDSAAARAPSARESRPGAFAGGARADRDFSTSHFPERRKKPRLSVAQRQQLGFADGSDPARRVVR